MNLLRVRTYGRAYIDLGEWWVGLNDQGLTVEWPACRDLTGHRKAPLRYRLLYRLLRGCGR